MEFSPERVGLVVVDQKFEAETPFLLLFGSQPWLGFKGYKM